jgi:hypothetical protein
MCEVKDRRDGDCASIWLAFVYLGWFRERDIPLITAFGELGQHFRGGRDELGRGRFKTKKGKRACGPADDEGRRG